MGIEGPDPVRALVIKLFRDPESIFGPTLTLEGQKLRALHHF